MIGHRLRRWLAGMAAKLHPDLDKAQLEYLVTLLRARGDALSIAAADRLERASRTILELAKAELTLRLDRLRPPAGQAASPELADAVAAAKAKLEELKRSHAPAAQRPNLRFLRPKRRR